MKPGQWPLYRAKSLYHAKRTRKRCCGAAMRCANPRSLGAAAMGARSRCAADTSPARPCTSGQDPPDRSQAQNKTTENERTRNKTKIFKQKLKLKLIMACSLVKTAGKHWDAPYANANVPTRKNQGANQARGRIVLAPPYCTLPTRSFSWCKTCLSNKPCVARSCRSHCGLPVLPGKSSGGGSSTCTSAEPPRQSIRIMREAHSKTSLGLPGARSSPGKHPSQWDSHTSQHGEGWLGLRHREP